jgi:hypothetical protein
MRSLFCILCLAVVLMVSIASAQDTTLTVLVYPQFVGGAPGSVAGLEQPVAVFVEWAGLEPNTTYEQQHCGFLTRGTSTVRGSKWANNSWISPSTKTPFMNTDANGKMKAWVFIRTPSSYIIGVDTALFRFRINKLGSSVNITKELGYFTALHVSDTAKGVTAGAVVYGFLDTVTQTNAGKFVAVYQNNGDARPLATWLVYKSPKDAIDQALYNTRLDTLYVRAGYFQLVVPTNTPIGRIEIRDSSNAILRYARSTAWKSGIAGSETNLNLQSGIILSYIRESENLPESFSLSQNYPNPFNPTTNIRFTLRQRGQVSLKIYDLAGRLVETLVNDVLAVGTYSVDWKPSNLASGTYFYTLEASQFKQTKKMLLLK